jgi:hypothetical protein
MAKRINMVVRNNTIVEVKYSDHSIVLLLIKRYKMVSIEIEIASVLKKAFV